MDSSNIVIKGIRDGLLITLAADGNWDTAESHLMGRIESQREFFRSARVALDVGERTLNRDEIRKLREKLAEHDVTLWAMLGKSPETIREARRMELETELKDGFTPTSRDEMEDGELNPIDSNEYGNTGVLVKNTLRSGRVIRHIGHVVVIGDVNPGAQIIAGGDVIVWGRLRGTVHAGANGNEDAMVCALDMRPTQLRIANHVAIAGDDGQRRLYPEFAFVRDGQIVAEEWGS